MTTVAFDGKTLAADTLVHGTASASAKKLFTLPDGSLFGVFPAHAGMNRWQRLGDRRWSSVPRTRGDEP